MLVPVSYAIFYEQRLISRGETWRVSFQDLTDNLISSNKNKHWESKWSQQQSNSVFITL